MDEWVVRARKRSRTLSVILLACLVLLLWLAPAERTLGQKIKLIYLHGALVRTAMALLAISFPLNVIALVRSHPRWLNWGKAFFGAAAIIWLMHTLFSMVTTRVTWGVWIAWFEPRTRFTFILASALIIAVVTTYVISDDRFTAFVFAVLAGTTLALLPQLGVIQHPLNPIGTSPSAQIKEFYVAILLVSLALGGLLVIWLQSKLTTGGLSQELGT